MTEDQMREQNDQGRGHRYEFRPGNVFHPVFTNSRQQEASMNQDQAKGKFDQIKGKLKETWGRLSDDEIALYNGKQDQFFGKLQEKYGLAKEEAEDRLKEIERASSYKDEKAA